MDANCPASSASARVRGAIIGGRECPLVVRTETSVCVGAAFVPSLTQLAAGPVLHDPPVGVRVGGTVRNAY